MTPLRVSRSKMLVGFLGLASTHTALAQSWNSASDFSPTANPNGAWSLGWATSRPVGLIAFQLSPVPSQSIPGFPTWLPVGRSLPFCFKNATSQPILYANDPVCPPGIMGVHPDGDGANAVLRWTAPFTGSVLVNAHFGTTTLDPTGNTVDVAVIHSGVLINSANPPRGRGHSYFSVINVSENDTLDFSVGNGGNGHSDDSTSIDIQLVYICPADFNQDGTTDFFDYLDFVAAFADNQLSADFNQDGIIDFFDYLDFVDVFASEC